MQESLESNPSMGALLKHHARLGSPLQIVLWWLAWLFLMLPMTLMFRWRRGDIRRRMPREGPFLLLPNHVSFFDPFWAGYWMVRRISFMASSALFRLPVLNVVLPLVGCFPKDKGVKDRDAMTTMAERYAANDVIMIFPEGNRSWDGRSSGVLPGIGRLIKRIEARVVTVRVVNGHLFQPRWAKYPRWIPIRCEVDDPTTFDASLSAEEITAEIIQRLHIEPKIEAPPSSFGWRMAHGLPAYLWACPDCFAPNGLRVDPRDGNRVCCHACDAHWRVDTSNRLHGTTETWVLDAFDGICAHFGSPPVLDPTLFAQEKVALRCLETRILRLEKGRKKTLLHEGTLEVTPEEVRLMTNEACVWRVPFSQMKFVSVEIANVLTVRTGAQLFRIQLGQDSPLMVAHFLETWLVHHRSRTLGRQED